MDLSPREAAFLTDEMERIQSSSSRQSYEKAAAKNLREKAESVLTE